MAKTERIEMRTDPVEHELISRAADASNQSMSAFVLAAAMATANSILARADTTIMPAEQFDELMASLDTPDEAPNLARIAARLRPAD
jgi:uncharacterized protein (DUF1778 family)